ncbi:DUF7285 family protein [Halovenus sp. HT40]|uniref:DUF7285 family protein n=1 Tax=Halovenus sp. HT40 TaxID=3126691 RepID=UPI00300ED836
MTPRVRSAGEQSTESVPTEDETTVGYRGQSEPLAALIAVSLVCLVVSTCVVLLAKTAETSGTDRAVVEPTADAVWQAISDDGMFDAGTTIKQEISPGTLPEGYNVAVTVSYIDGNGERTSVDSEAFDSSGEPASLSVPEDAEQVTRAVTVRVGPGDKRPGQLTVEVWK